MMLNGILLLRLRLGWARCTNMLLVAELGLEVRLQVADQPRRTGKTTEAGEGVDLGGRRLLLGRRRRGGHLMRQAWRLGRRRRQLLLRLLLLSLLEEMVDM